MNNNPSDPDVTLSSEPQAHALYRLWQFVGLSPDIRVTLTPWFSDQYSWGGSGLNPGLLFFPLCWNFSVIISLLALKITNFERFFCEILFLTTRGCHKKNFVMTRPYINGRLTPIWWRAVAPMQDNKHEIVFQPVPLLDSKMTNRLAVTLPPQEYTSLNHLVRVAPTTGESPENRHRQTGLYSAWAWGPEPCATGGSEACHMHSA